jgi:hypothetical protein
MLKTAGAVEQDGSLNFVKNSKSVTVPKEFKARSNAPKVKLAYITDAEAKMLKKKKPGTPHKGPKGIPSYDSFGSIDASGKDTGVAGSQVSAAESGDFTGFQGTGGGPELPPGVKRKPSKEAQDLRSAFIAAGGGQRVNPRFFDSRDTVSPAELRLAKQFAPKAFRKGRNQGLLSFLGSGGLFGNIIRGLGQKLGFGKKFNEPTYDMRRFSNLPLGGSASFQNLDIRDKFDRRITDDEDNNPIPIVTDSDMSLIPDRGLLEVPGIPITPFQKDIIEDQNYDEQVGDIRDIMAADGGMIGGGIMDAAGRQNYFLGKLVKKATRAVKKIVKSPVGKLGLGAALAFTPFGKAAFTKFKALSPGMKALIGGGVLSSLPLLFQQEEEQGEGLGTTGSVGGQIDPRAYTDPYGVLFPAFRANGSPKEGEKGVMKMAGYLDPMSEKNDMAMEMFGKQLKDLTEDELDILDEEIQRLRSKFLAEGGSTEKEPVAKKTMPLLDMGGQEMDLRAEGGFVPIGRMEKADDVPARLSKNEFVFTADAVRNAGDGDVDKGAEVMYNMMKNLEAGGDVSEESQGLEGARKMFQTSKRLEEVI